MQDRQRQVEKNIVSYWTLPFFEQTTQNILQVKNMTFARDYIQMRRQKILFSSRIIAVFRMIYFTFMLTTVQDLQRKL